MNARYWYWMWHTFLGPSRLRRKFVKTFIFAGLVPLVLMGGISFYLVNLTHRVDVHALEENVAQQTSLQIQQVLDEVSSNFDFTVTFEEFAPISFNQQSFILESLIERDPSLVDLSFICTTPEQCELGKETSRITRVAGTITPSEDLRSFAGGELFESIANGAPYRSPLVFGRQSNITIATPVLNKHNEVIAGLTGTITIDAIQRIIETIRLGETGYVYAVTREGKIFAHPDSALIGKVASFPPVASGQGNVLTPAVYENTIGEAVSGFAVLIPDTSWIAVAEWPRAETQKLIQAILWQILGFSALALAILGIIASWVAFKLIQPIAKLSQGTSIIGGGNFDYRVTIKTGDELEDLGKNLNKMAENLKGLDELKELRLRANLLSENLKKEQELSKLKDQFITTVSHQFNTPLSVINWAVSAFSEPKLTKKKIQETAAVIAQSQRDIANIVNDLVTLSEIGFQYEKNKAKAVDLAEMVQKSIEYFKNAMDIKGVSVNFAKRTENTVASVHEFTIRKVVDNLIDNAISYSNRGSEIQVALEGTDADLTLSVTDQGIGIPEDDQSHIFQQFFRAKNAVKKKNVGTGLGLYIAKTIIEGHKGSVWFTSEENRGSTFSMKLPRE